MVNEVLAVDGVAGRRGMTMMVVTHEMGFAPRRQPVVFMAEGTVVEDAAPEDFLPRPQSARARDSLGKILATRTMRSLSRRLLIIALLGIALVAALSGCGGSDNKITIGTKFDQPGLAVKKPDGSMAGFDVDVATYVAGKLRLPARSRSSGRGAAGQRDADPERPG